MRYLAIGDIHGCVRALVALIDVVKIQPEDVLITLGDYVDRGPDARAVLDFLIAHQRENALVALRGNHEVMMLNARYGGEGLKTWLEVGGDWALRSYAPAWRSGTVEDIPKAHWQFVEQTRPFFETAGHFFVHANAYSDLPLEEQPDYMLYWEFFEDPPPHVSGKVMVCGHTPQWHVPRNIGHAVCIDTGACLGGWLTCLDVMSGCYWQANEQGETRQGWLGE